MAFDRHIHIPYTVYGGVSTGDNGAVDTLSGFTNKLTTFLFVPSTDYNTFNFISNDTMLWDMGDGTIIKSTSARHIYSVPGIYNVSLVAYDSGGNEYLSTHTAQVSVSNLIDTKLVLDTQDVAATVNIPTGVHSASASPIKINRFTSHQSYSQLSGSSYTLNLFASGSNSRKLDPNNVSKWSHIDRSWSFYKPVTANNGEIQFTPIDRIDTTSEPLYYETGQKFGQQFFRRVSKADVDSGANTNTAFVGTSGSAEFIYGDDTAKHTRQPVFVFVSLDTSKFLDQREVLNSSPYIYNPGDPDQIKYFESSQLVVPIRVRHRPATEIVFTSTGMRSIGFDIQKWQCTRIPFFINLADTNGYFIKNYSALSAIQAVDGASSNTTINVTNLSAVSSNNTNTVLLSSNFYRNSDGQLPRDLDGMFRGFFIPYYSSDTCSVDGQVYINEYPHSVKDVYLGFIGNHGYNKLCCTFFSDTYEINGSTGTLQSKQEVKFTPITFTASGPIFSIATVPEDITRTDNSVLGAVVGTLTDTISAINSKSTAVSAIVLGAVRDKVGRGASITSSDNLLQDYGNGTEGTFDPVHVSFDENKNLFVACSGGAVVLKLDTTSDVEPPSKTSVGMLLNVIKMPDNRRYNTTTTTDGVVSINDDPSGQYGLLTVNQSEPDKESNVWVSFTNPISSFVMKYYVGETGSTKLSGHYFSPQGIIPTDMNVTNQNELWVCTEHALPNSPRFSVGTQRVSALSADGDTIKYEFKGTMETADGDAVVFESGEVVSITGFVDEYYNGQFLIDSVFEGNVITVKPYIGRMNNLGTDSINETGIDANVYYSDRVYKLDKYGNVIHSVSGFMKPSCMVTDKWQNVWVGHNIDTLTRVTTAGIADTSIRAQNTTFTNIFMSADATYSYAASASHTHFGGISFDIYDTLIAVNAFENKIYKIPTYTPTVSASYDVLPSSTPINVSSRPQWIFGRHQAHGDWTGYKWQNKYVNTTGIKSITGALPLSVLPKTGKYNIAKINENYDPIETIKSYRMQPILVDRGKVLFDDLYGSIVGSLSTGPTEIGRLVYEKISNFPDNIGDVDTCNIPALYSAYSQYDLDIKNFNFTYPGGLSRIMNMLSIPHKKLWGDRSKYDRDFEKYGISSNTQGKNLGTELDISSYMVSAGTPIVARQLFNNEYLFINTGYVSGESTNPNYNSVAKSLSSYPLSSYDPAWGWKLGAGVSNDNVSTFYKFYSFVEHYNNILLEGVIDWNNTYTNIQESVSSVDGWTQDHGIVDTAIDYELRKGLNLFTSYSAANTDVL